MIYKHEWVNDWARYFAADEDGSGREFKRKPTKRYGRVDYWDGDVSASVEHGVKGDWEGSLQQRFTNQQMELEAQGWTLWNAGDNKPNVDDGLMVDLIDEDGDKDSGVEFSYFTWGSNMNAIAYRLSNAPGYKDGARIDVVKEHHKKAADFMLNGKDPEWKAGELPKEGTKCEAIWSELPDGGSPEWLPVTFKRGFDMKLWFSHLNIEIVIPAHAVKFRPIKTEKERAVEAALPHSNRTPRNFRSFAEDLYDAGMLSMPKGEE